MKNDTLGKRVVDLYEETDGQSGNPKNVFQKLI